MALSHGSKAKVYAGGFDLTTYLRKVQTSGSVDTADASTFGLTSKKKVAGLRDGKLTAEGVFSKAALATPADNVDDVMQAALGSDSTLWLYAPAGGAVGSRCTMLMAATGSYEVANDVADVVTCKAEAEAGSGGRGTEGGIILNSASLAGTTNGAAQDNGALTSNGAGCYLHVPALVGAAPSVTVKVQHSVDNVTWVDLATFNLVTALNASQLVEVTGTVNRYTRAQVTFGGTTTSITAVVAIARR
jgi:hypothetical protein